jgi:hypothetical protein
MAAKPLPLRATYASGITPPSLPCSFTLSNYYGSADAAPTRLDVLPDHAALDGVVVPEPGLEY